VRAIVLLLAALVVYMLALEVAMRTVLPRISHGQRRVAQDARVAEALTPQSTGGARTVLLIGNSLLEQGVDRQELWERLQPHYAVAYYPIEGTTYLDWLYGLRRLFARGARPSAVVLCISGRQLLSNATNGEMFAYWLLQARDLPRVVQDGRLDMMTASAYFFASKSAWLGARTGFRDNLLQKWLPGADLLAAHLTVVDPLPLVVNEKTLGRALERLRILSRLAQDNGALFVYLVPPTLNTADVAPAIAGRARSAGIPVLIPYKPGEMSSAKFVDGFHLNPKGATDFSDRIAPALLGVLGGAGRASDGADVKPDNSPTS
jgi:hypothetical protein